jgi:hypothetical protein
MAKLYVTEYSDIAQTVRGSAPVGQENADVVEQTPVVIGGGSLASAAFAATTTYVRLHADAICSVAFGTGPTATANSRRMGADTTEYFGVPKGSSYKVAVISNT